MAAFEVGSLTDGPPGQPAAEPHETVTTTTDPLFILGSPRSFTSLLSTMIGQHPQAYGLPELNLFLSDTVEQMLIDFTGYKQIQMHGLLRTVAQLYGGEQTIRSIDMARRWIARRIDHATDDVYRELCRKIAPLRAVDKSPAYALKRETLEAIGRAFPRAHFLHLLRNPRTQGESIMNVASGAMAVLANSIDYQTDPPTVDPQIAWYATQRTILGFFETIAPERVLRVRGEAVLEDPRRELAAIARWAGLADDEAAVESMMHPEASPFATPGPFGAHLGNDINFLKSPAYRPGAVSSPPLAGPLPWRADGQGFRQEVVKLANELGYES